LKYAGTVTTAFLIFLFVYVSAISLIFDNTIAEISSGANVLVSPPTTVLIYGFVSLSTISYGKNLLSCYTSLSANFLPINLLTSYTVLVGFIVT